MTLASPFGAKAWGPLYGCTAVCDGGTTVGVCLPGGTPGDPRHSRLPGCRNTGTILENLKLRSNLSWGGDSGHEKRSLRLRSPIDSGRSHRRTRGRPATGGGGDEIYIERVEGGWKFVPAFAALPPWYSQSLLDPQGAELSGVRRTLDHPETSQGLSRARVPEQAYAHEMDGCLREPGSGRDLNSIKYEFSRKRQPGSPVRARQFPT